MAQTLTIAGLGFGGMALVGAALNQGIFPEQLRIYQPKRDRSSASIVALGMVHPFALRRPALVTSLEEWDHGRRFWIQLASWAGVESAVRSARLVQLVKGEQEATMARFTDAWNYSSGPRGGFQWTDHGYWVHGQSLSQGVEKTTAAAGVLYNEPLAPFMSEDGNRTLWAIGYADVAYLQEQLGHRFKPVAGRTAKFPLTSDLEKHVAPYLTAGGPMAPQVLCIQLDTIKLVVADDLCFLGSTWERPPFDQGDMDKPSPLIQILEKASPQPLVTVVLEAVFSAIEEGSLAVGWGIRPATAQRQPLLVESPRGWHLNGLGSRGLSWAPPLAERWIKERT